MSVAPVAAAAAIGAIAGEVGKEDYDALRIAAGDEDTDRGRGYSLLQLEALARIERHLREAKELSRPTDHSEVVYLDKVTPYLMHDLGRRHNSIFIASAQPIDVITVVGSAMRTLQVGWNALDAPESASLLLDQSAAGASVLVIIRWGDEVLQIPYTT